MVLARRIVCTVATFTACLVGCTGQTTTANSETLAAPSADAHSHPTKGPHDGELIELGNHEYHAELLHDGKSVTIYVVNQSADGVIPIEATEVTINMNHDGQPAQFALAASPEETDPAGKSSRFTSDDAALTGNLDSHGANARLVVSINGKSYRGEIAHSHAH